MARTQAPPTQTLDTELSVDETVLVQEVVQAELAQAASIDVAVEAMAATSSNAAVIIVDKLNNQVYGYASAANLLGAGASLNMSNYPRSIFEIINTTGTPIPVNVPGGPSVTVPANGVAALSTHPNIAPGKSIQGRAGQNGTTQGYSFS